MAGDPAAGIDGDAYPRLVDMPEPPAPLTDLEAAAALKAELDRALTESEALRYTPPAAAPEDDPAAP